MTRGLSRSFLRVLPSLCFMRKRLRFEPELDLAHSFRAARSAAIGHGARQVPVAQPAMVLLLERQLVAAYKNGHPDWLGFLLTWCQVTGCVRFVHLQRSRLIQMDQRTLLFECLRGKQRHLRAGFQVCGVQSYLGRGVSPPGCAQPDRSGYVSYPATRRVAPGQF